MSTMDTINRSRTARKPLAIGVAAGIALGGAFALGATAPANAMPLSMSHLTLKEAAPSDVIDVRRRSRRHRSNRAIAGMALGIIGGAIAAHQYDRYHRRHYRSRYYHPYHYYGPPSCIRRHGAVYCR